MAFHIVSLDVGDKISSDIFKDAHNYDTIRTLELVGEDVKNCSGKN